MPMSPFIWVASSVARGASYVQLRDWEAGVGKREGKEEVEIVVGDSTRVSSPPKGSRVGVDGRLGEEAVAMLLSREVVGFAYALAYVLDRLQQPRTLKSPAPRRICETSSWMESTTGNNFATLQDVSPV